MQLSPLSLESYYLKELHFAVNDQKPIKGAEFDNLEIGVKAETQIDENNPLRWSCELTIESKRDPDSYLPYAFVVIYVGIFQVSEKFPSERVELLAKTNGPAVLYSAAREMMVSLTGRGVFPPLLLPSITFLSPPDKEGASSHKPVKRLSGKVTHKRKAAK
jgi:preprotein translocase subunit SecB